MPGSTTSDARRVRRALSRELRSAPSFVRRVAERLVARDGPWDRFVAYELLNRQPVIIHLVDDRAIRRLGRGIDSWGDVDMFACLVAGPAWRDGRVSDAELLRWTRSRDRWWRRAAVVSTVALNSRARGGTGDAVRTLRVCSAVLDDRDPMVVKAVSWALRELAKWDPAVVRVYIAANDARLAALVRREVTAKLTTGLKNPRRSSRPESPARS
jgi:3-methyladenine DNA glycosylase AlkD